MGILDSLRGAFANPSVSQGLLATGLGTLAANRGGTSGLQAIGQGGLLGMNAYNNAQQARQNAAMDQQKMALMQQQQQQAETEAQMKALAFQQQQQQLDTMNQIGTFLAGGTPPALQGQQGGPAMTGGAAGTTGGTTGTAAPQADNPYAVSMRPGSATGAALAGASPTQQNAGTSSGQPGMGANNPQVAGMLNMVAMLPPQKQQQALMMIRMGQGDKLADLFKTNLDMNSRSGVIWDKDTGQVVGSSPMIQNGVAQQIVYDAQGNPSQQILPGGLNALGQQKSVENAFVPATMQGPGGTTIATNQEWLRTHPGTVVGASPVQQARDTMLDKNFTDTDYNPAVSAGQAAEGQLAQIQALRNLNLDTGASAEAKQKWASMLDWLHIPGGDAILGDQKIFNNVVATQLMKQLQAQKGPQTEGDAARAAQTFVQVGNTPRANEYILDMAQAVAEQQKAQQVFYQRALAYATQNNLPIWQISQQWDQVQPSIWDSPSMKKWIPKEQKQGQPQQQGGK